MLGLDVYDLYQKFDGTFNYVVTTMSSTNFSMKAIIATWAASYYTMCVLHSKSDGPFHSVPTMLATNINMKVTIATLNGHVLNLFGVQSHVFMLNKKCGGSIFLWRNS